MREYWKMVLFVAVFLPWIALFGGGPAVAWLLVLALLGAPDWAVYTMVIPMIPGVVAGCQLGTRLMDKLEDRPRRQSRTSTLSD